MSILLTAPYVVTHDPDVGVLYDAGVLIEGDTITAIDDAQSLLNGFDGRRQDFPDGVIMPGLINAHTHLYSAFARGISIPGEPPENFPQILERLWWRLDRCLTPEDNHYSALLGVLDAARFGVTTLFDHHASPNSAAGSLDRVAEAFEMVGLRGVLCYEVSDRDGAEIAAAGLEENRRFIQKVADHPTLKAAFGVHASFTVSDDTLRQAAESANELGSGIHIHVAEDPCDPAQSHTAHGLPLVERLARNGALGPKSIAAHCIHIDEAELELLLESDTFVVHNPQSNMNNAVGTAAVVRWNELGLSCGIGSDGMTANIAEDFRVADLLHKSHHADPRVSWAEIPSMALQGNRHIAQRYFDRPLGVLQVGAAADVIVKQYRPYTALNADNFWGHFLFAMYHEPVRATLVNGRPIWLDGHYTGDLDLEQITNRSLELAADLWKRFG